MASTSAFFSAKMSTCQGRPSLVMGAASVQMAPALASVLPLLPSPLVWASLVGCTHGWGRLLQALEQVHHLRLLLYIFHFLPSEEPDQVILRAGSPVMVLPQR